MDITDNKIYKCFIKRPDVYLAKYKKYCCSFIISFSIFITWYWRNRVTASNIEEIVHERNGEVLQFFADTFNEEKERKLNKLIAEEIAAEIKEFSNECEDFISDLTKKISNKKFKVFELEDLSDEIHKLDRWRIKLIQKHSLDTNNIEILNKETRKCKERLNEFEEKVLPKGEASSQ